MGEVLHDEVGVFEDRQHPKVDDEARKQDGSAAILMADERASHPVVDNNGRIEQQQISWAPGRVENAAGDE